MTTKYDLKVNSFEAFKDLMLRAECMHCEKPVRLFLFNQANTSKFKNGFKCPHCLKITGSDHMFVSIIANYYEGE